MIRKLVLEEILGFFGMEKLLEELPTHAEAIQAIVDWNGSEEVFFELAQFGWIDSVDHVYIAIVEILDIEKAKERDTVTHIFKMRGWWLRINTVNFFSLVSVRKYEFETHQLVIGSCVHGAN